MADMFAEIEGVQGDSTDSMHKDWIELVAYDHGLMQAAGGVGSAQGALTGGRVEHQLFTITKLLDKASPTLALLCCQGKHIPTIKVQLCRAMGEKTPFMLYTLSDCVLATVAVNGSGGTDQIPAESISVRYGSIKWEYTPTDPTGGGKTGASVQAGWSVLENKPL